MQIVLENGAVLDDSNIMEESMVLQESICSDNNLRFGSCEASVFKIKLIEQFLPISSQKITASILHNGELFQLGKYKVLSDTPTADRRYRDIVAYDAMYDIINADVAEWYNRILPDADSQVTLKQFRDSFISYFGIEQEDVVLVNDDMVVKKTVEPTSMSGKTVITAICEINGCFGHIGRDGKFQYVFLRDLNLYPSDTLYPSDDLFPGQPNGAEELSKSRYISATYEDYETERIDKLQICQEEDDIGYIYGNGNNCYIVQDNFLVYGKSAEDLHTIAENLYSIIGGVWYRPAHVDAIGNPCLAVGDGITLETSNGTTIYTYILQRTLKGIFALRDTYDAEGEQYQRKDVNSVRESIIQLKGKTNKLTRTLEETKSEIVDMEKNLSSQIKQNAEQILLRVEKDKIISEINQTAEKITISAQKIDLVGLVNADEFVTKYATIDTLNATSATLQNLIATKIDASTVKADYMEVENWTSSGYIKASRIDVDSLLARTSVESSNAYFNGLHVAKLWDSDGTGLKTEWKYSSTLGWYLCGTQSS